MYAVAVGMPLSNLPQINQVYTTRVTTGLSLSTWVTYTILCIIPLMYAFMNKLKPLIISNILWTIINLCMIYGIIRYTPNLIPQDFDTLLFINSIGKTMSLVGMFFVSTACALFAVDLIGVNNVKKLTT